MSADKDTLITQKSMSEPELCEYWQKCRKSLLNWRKAGKMPPHFRRGAEIRYLVSEIEKFEQNSAQ
ncbi:MAG: helix-turn-helix domain-containing protein [Lentisphaerota bacterium]